MKTIGVRIKNAMNEANINQKQLQSITKIDQHIISDYLNDKRSPRIDELEKISVALQCNLLDLLPNSILINNNIYHDQSASYVQNQYLFDKNFIEDKMKENILLKIENDSLKSEILNLKTKI